MTTAAAHERQSGQCEGCPRCRDLRRRYLDQATPNPGACLYWWALHRLDDHHDTAGPQPGCQECKRWAGGPGLIHRELWARWARTHFLRCGLVCEIEREEGHGWIR